MHVFQRDQREVTLKSTNTFHIIPQFHQSMFIFTTSANRPINMERSAEVFNEVLQLQKQETPDCAGLLAWYMATEERRGLGTRLAMRCKICRYVFKRYNM